MFIKFVQDETHAVHKRIHIRRFPFCIRGATVGCESGLERFEILHPFQSEIMRLHIGFVEDKNKWKFRLVKDTARWNRWSDG